MNSSRKTICVIDDERQVCDLIRLILESRDYECVVAHDGRTGLERVRERHPAAVITDMMMPGMNGQDLLAELRRDAATRDIPVMVMTGLTENQGYTDEEWRERLEVQAFLSKPLDPDTLLDTLEKLLSA